MIDRQYVATDSSGQSPNSSKQTGSKEKEDHDNQWCWWPKNSWKDPKIPGMIERKEGKLITKAKKKLQRPKAVETRKYDIKHQTNPMMKDGPDIQFIGKWPHLWCSSVLVSPALASLDARMAVPLVLKNIAGDLDIFLRTDKFRNRILYNQSESATAFKYGVTRMLTPAISLNTCCCARSKRAATSLKLEYIALSSFATARVIREAMSCRSVWSIFNSHGDPGARNAL